MGNQLAFGIVNAICFRKILAGQKADITLNDIVEYLDQEKAIELLSEMKDISEAKTAKLPHGVILRKTIVDLTNTTSVEKRCFDAFSGVVREAILGYQENSGKLGLSGWFFAEMYVWEVKRRSGWFDLPEN